MISIIVPVYNVERWLRECVDSIIAQTYTDWELILVDDGSTDSSGHICDTYAARDSRIKVLHGKNGGLSYARNRGIDASVGDRLAFVDSDDTIARNFLEKLGSVDADIVCCGFLRDDKIRYRDYQTTSICYLNNRQALIDGLYQRNVNTSACGKLFRRYLFDTVRFAEGMYYEDLEIFPRIMSEMTGRLALIKDKLVFYRDTPGSIINTWNDHRLDVLTVTEAIENMFDDEELFMAARGRRFSANYNMMLLSLSHGRKEIAAQCYEFIKSARIQILTDRNVRIKNKAGALLSYAGMDMMKLLSRL
ncbi:MAG: glycosyltransferase family 2 protein [Bacteroidales bacterium]|nr:glycosyltransferase family 2 protein [Bacteroidales bacterium]